MDIQIVNRSEQILDPHMDLIDKVGKMARICYKGQGDDRATSMRIIKHCIENGHESILEHGIISVYVNPEVTEDGKHFAEKYVNNAEGGVQFARIWNSVATDAQAKYLESFADPELFMKHMKRIRPDVTLKPEDNRIMHCLVGDIRAWRQVMRERIYIATSTNNNLQFVLDLLVLYKLYCVDGEGLFLGDLIKQVNGFMEDDKFCDRMLIGADEIPKDKRNVFDVVSFYFKDDMTVLAEQASSAASLSVIITTDRATTHQLVRHRKNVAYSQESQRYVNYDKKGYRCIPLTVESSKFPDDFIDDYDLGKVRSTSEAYKEWYKAMEDAFQHYHNLQHIYDDESGKSDLVLPPETCRGVLPNDTATTIGVTWMRPAAFVNFCYWRLDHHAQYSIRAMLARIVKDMYLQNHPFIETIPYNAAMRWLNQIKEQKIFKDDAPIDVIIRRREAIQKFVEEQMARMKKEREDAAKSTGKKD